MNGNTNQPMVPNGPQFPPPQRRGPMEIAALVAEYVKSGVVHCFLILLTAAAIGVLFLGLKGIWFLVDKCSKALGV